MNEIYSKLLHTHLTVAEIVKIKSALRLEEKLQKRIVETNGWKDHPQWVHEESISSINREWIINLELSKLSVGSKE